MRALNVILGLVLLCTHAAAFTDYLLKKCHQAGFCQRNRDYAKNIQLSHNSYYHIDELSVVVDNTTNTLHADIVKTVPREDIGDVVVRLPFTLAFQQDMRSVRFTIDEKPIEKFNNELLTPYRYNETANWSFANHSDVLDNAPLQWSTQEQQQESNALAWLSNIVFNADEEKVMELTTSGSDLRVRLFLETCQINVYDGKELVLAINDRSLLNFEHHRTLEDNFQNMLPEESSYNMFADDFEYSSSDHIPFGPQSVALDFTFAGFNNLFGIPEHADSLRLRETLDEEPYRLFNVDVFQYNLNSRMPMYGAIPLLMSANKDRSVGVFWNNPADTWVDIHYEGSASQSHFMSETGVIDVVVFLGDKPADITDQFTHLTGRPMLPLMSAIGYHQCRWNYNDELDVLTVQENMDREDIPFDFIWLDLEYTDDRKYFTWRPDSFATPGKMLQKLAKYGRQLTVLIDPHLKFTYEASNKVKEHSAEIKNFMGKTYIGRCWPEDSIWIDTMGKIGRTVWDSLFKEFITEKLPSFVDNLQIWNDMNEPSIFNGPETTAPKDLIHDGGFEERAIHNVYGLTVHEATYDSMKQIYSKFDKRPFILSRAYFAGSQRTVAVWTGDNIANWDYLKMSIPMVLSSNIVGLPFNGADVAGFDGNPSPELIARWYQTGIWYPFFRGHAHIDSIRREPYLLEEPIKSNVRDSIRLRYALLPTLYSAFHQSSVDGSPIMKPMFFEYPEYSELYDIDDQFYVGDYGIVVKPITSTETFSTEMVLAPGIYYDLQSLKSTTVDKLDTVTVDAPLDKIPAFIEGGHLLIKKEVYRRSSKLMINDPYTIVVAPTLSTGSASGKLYVDDGVTFEYESGNYLDVSFTFTNNSVLENTVVHEPSDSKTLGNMYIHKIVLATDGNNVNVGKTAKITVGSDVREVAVEFDEETSSAVIRDAQIRIDEPWRVEF